VEVGGKLKKALPIIVALLISCSPSYQTSSELPLEPTATPAPVGPRFHLGDRTFHPPDHVVLVYVPAHDLKMGSTDEQLKAALEQCGENSAECRDRFEREQPAHQVLRQAARFLVKEV